MGIIYGLLAILCCGMKRRLRIVSPSATLLLSFILFRGMKRRLRIVSPRATLLLSFTDKECRNVNGPCKRSQSVAKNA